MLLRKPWKEIDLTRAHRSSMEVIELRSLVLSLEAEIVRLKIASGESRPITLGYGIAAS